MTNFSDFSSGLADVVERTAQGVVTVLAPRPVSGTVVGEGLILTAAHVLHADEVQVVTPDGRTLTASVAGRDPASDLALLKAEGLNVAPLSNGQETRVGELLVAVGRPPHGVQATLGLYNRPQRGWLIDSATPFRGVSGGALVDARGSLVGVLNAGAGFSRGTLLAVPAERALKVAQMLGTAGRVARGFLGITTQPVHFPETREQAEENAGIDGDPRGEWRGRGPGRAGPGGRGRGPWSPEPHGHAGHGRGGWGGRGRHFEASMGHPMRGMGRPGGRFGLTIVSVEAGSPAAQAGLKVGDVLLALEGQAVRHPQELLRTVHDRAGDQLTARILRGGEEQDITLSIGER
ncbi:S1C family serine protease [Deinococcus fonticola]|uniref:S1C family serine protease n=1 Tax=Deinococcus fonticola TaxID=2528713 RepID=UPI00107571D0|nr:trypsin-like peptidase domain-containing protein [Deinococcus fonticola]